MKASSNPWGVDENKYFSDVGGVQDFLAFESSLASKLPQEYLTLKSEHDCLMDSPHKNPSESSYIQVLDTIIEMQGEFHKDSLEYEHLSSLAKFSDLLLSHSCDQQAKFYEKLAKFLQSILNNKDTLIKQLKQAQLEQDNCLILEQRYHSPIIKLLEQMASDLDQNAKLNIVSRQGAVLNPKSLQVLVDSDRVSSQCTLCQRYLEQLSQYEQVMTSL